jgi:ATP-dependent DNA ligase
MRTVIDVLEELEANPSRNFKEELLNTHRKNSLLKRVFAVTGDPYINFYVNKLKMPPPTTAPRGDDEALEHFLDFITGSLAIRSIVGNAAREAVVSFFSSATDLQQKWCLRILLKNLRCGVQAATVNKVWPGTIVEFSVQLAEVLASRHQPGVGIILTDDVKYPVRAEPKLDGLRCVAVKSEGEVTLFTRSGTVLETLPTVSEALRKAPWDNFVLDGEIMGTDWNESASVVMSHKKNKDDSNMVFHVFDAMPFVDWRDRDNPMPLHERVELVEELVKQVSHRSVVQVAGVDVSSQEDMLRFYSSCLDKGYEGIMVKDRNALYTFKRSSAVKKLKPTATYEGVVVGSYEGTRGSKREGLWGGFEVVLPNGIVTRVGGGFSDKLKAQIDLDPLSWVGRVLELEGQPEPGTADGLTKDGRVRFPVFLRERDPNDVDGRVIAAGTAHLGGA